LGILVCAGYDYHRRGRAVEDTEMADEPDEAELERLGLYDSSAPDADDRLRLLRRLFELGANIEEVQAAGVAGLGSLSLDLSIRPSGPTYELDDFAESSGVDPELVRRFWLALGLPTSGSIPLKVTPDAADALRLLIAISGLVTEDAALAVTRVVGSSAARIAEALAGALRLGVEVPSLEAGSTYSEVVDQYSTAGRDLLPSFLEAVNAVFRRHLVLVSYQLWSTDEERAGVTLQRTVGFADVVGSTEVVRAGSVATMARMVRQFEEQVWDLVTRAGGRVVKLIGDEAMFVVEDPQAACQVALELIDRSVYPVRVGLAHGPVVGLFGDYYGEVVNLAARLVGVAPPSGTLVSDSVRRATGDAFRFELQPSQPLKGFTEPVHMYRLHPSL
jgi:adenylate cyclase